MTKGVQIALWLVLSVVAIDASHALDTGRAEGSTIKGVAMTSTRQPLPDYFLRLRSLDTTRLVKVARTDSSGNYEFDSVEPGLYYVEILDRANHLVGTDGPITVAPGGKNDHSLRTRVITAAALSATAVAV